MKGQTLIETLVALAVGVIVVTAITVTAVSSLSNAQYIRSQDIATKYAEEGIEILRKIRNSSYAGFGLYNGTYCLDYGQLTLGSPVASCTTPNIESAFIRSIQIQQNGCSASVSRATVVVSYTSGKCVGGAFCHTSRLVSCFSTINPVSGP